MQGSPGGCEGLDEGQQLAGRNGFGCRSGTLNSFVLGGVALPHTAPVFGLGFLLDSSSCTKAPQFNPKLQISSSSKVVLYGFGLGAAQSWLKNGRLYKHFK